ncbi:MAG: alanine--tRNA ligase-related protein [Candidatus Woesearchaeota archaeon]
MTKSLYMDDMFLKEFDAVVRFVSDGKYIILDQTAFYPRAGGVDHDTGKIKTEDGKEYDVVFVGKFNGEISHEVDKQGLKQGDKVHCTLDWERRYRLMRYHTSAHVLSAVFAKDAGALITGNSLNTEKGRIDFSLEEFDKEKLGQYFDKANEIIQKDYPVKIYNMDRSEVEKKPELVKLAKGLPPNIDVLRIVDISGYDAQPDGGCHVKSLKDVGNIVYLKAENKGAKNRRVYYTLEP